MHVLNRRIRFGLGVVLAVGPVLVAIFLPGTYLASLGFQLVSSTRVPLALFCLAALASEGFAIFLFFHARVFPTDRITSWSEIAAAVAGVSTIAFLIAAVANAIQVW